jgi:hypothetical protein
MEDNGPPLETFVALMWRVTFFEGLINENDSYC